MRDDVAPRSLWRSAMNKLVALFGLFALRRRRRLSRLAPVEQHAPTQATTTPTPDPTPVATVDAGTDDAGNCGGMEFALSAFRPTSCSCIDRSGSMGDSIGGGSKTTK